MNPNFQTLRDRHPVIYYRGHSVKRNGDLITVTFAIDLEPEIEFRPTLSFLAPGVSDEVLEPFLANIGLVEVISYWKAACPRTVKIEAFSLNRSQVDWWRDLFIHGLGEFFFNNGIDPTIPDLLTIETSGKQPIPASPPDSRGRSDKTLVLAAGGKDSSLALELLNNFEPGADRLVMLLNPSRSARDSVKIAQYPEPIIVNRTIDRNLITLNAQGYLNGHTPFSAYLAFLSTMIAKIHDCSEIVVCNERSANEANTIFHGLPVNHQYSKSSRFERRFRNYCTQYLKGSASYFSLIRPLLDIQVSRLFAELAPQHLNSFRSCNVGQRDDRWCGTCPKCAFVGITLAPFVSAPRLIEIFGCDLFNAPQIIQAISELTGVSKHKPFECVGTLAESRAALSLTLTHYSNAGLIAPSGLKEIATALAAQGALPTLTEAESILRSWSDEHEVPPKYADKLRSLIERDR